MDVDKLKSLIEKTPDINKAVQIVSIDLKKKSYIADYMIIASELHRDICSPYLKFCKRA